MEDNTSKAPYGCLIFCIMAPLIAFFLTTSAGGIHGYNKINPLFLISLHGIIQIVTLFKLRDCYLENWLKLLWAIFITLTPIAGVVSFWILQPNNVKSK